MSVLKINPRNAVLLLIIVAMAILRIASFTGWGPLTVFTPIGAMALFGGAYFNGNVKPYAFPLLTLFLSDVIVMQLFFAGSEYRTGLLYSGWVWTYLAFALMAIAGKLIIRSKEEKFINGSSSVTLPGSPPCVINSGKKGNGKTAGSVRNISNTRNYTLCPNGSHPCRKT